VSEAEFDLITTSLSVMRNHYFEDGNRHTVACDRCMKLRDELLRQEEQQEMTIDPRFAGSALIIEHPLNQGELNE
jgi:hypothetical protein